MIDSDIRNAILTLRNKGHAIRKIARALGVSRNTVRRILEDGSFEVPQIERQSQAAPHIDEIRGLHHKCRGNLVRVWEELEARGVYLPYSTLTAFCRRHGIGLREKKRAGSYEFAPGEEMQHDTSPHEVQIGARMRKVQCASLVLCFSRMLYAQLYPTFNRFYCKIFLTEALKYLDGAAARCMIDNTSVVIAYGTGANAVAAPEMKALSDRFDFEFVAHEKGDKNRSGRVERPFHYIENNFYPGRTFCDLEDLNRQLRAWCDKANRSFKPRLRAKPLELYQTEKPYLKPLPIHIPEVYAPWRRIVDIEGYVTLHTNRYSAPTELIGRHVEVRESQDLVRIFYKHKAVAVHKRQEEGLQKRLTLPEHSRASLLRRGNRPQLPEEKTLMLASPELKALVEALRSKADGRIGPQIRRLNRMFIDYPTQELSKAAAQALHYGLLDLDRIERMLLRNIAGEYFRLSPQDDKEKGDEDE